MEFPWRTQALAEGVLESLSSHSQPRSSLTVSAAS